MNYTSVKSNLLKEEYFEIDHKSGLKIFVMPKPDYAGAFAMFGTKYGSVDTCFKTDKEESFVKVPEGIAHFLEHKLFESEELDAFARFEKTGASANAFTSFDRTCYIFQCSDNFNESLEVLLDFVKAPYFTEETVQKEQGIIGQEIRMYQDSPDWQVLFNLLGGIYHNNPVKIDIAGTVESIAEITAELLYSCYNTFYNLHNMVLVVCGDVDFDEVIKIADEHLPTNAEDFSTVARNENALESPEVNLPYVERRMQLSKPIFNIGYKDIDIPTDPAERQRKDAIMAILDEMIFSRAGELYNSLFERDIISPNLSYGYSITKDAAYNSVAGEADDPSLVLREISAYIEELRERGLPYDDFLRGKRVMYSEFVKSFDSTDNIANNLLAFFCEGAELLSYADIIESVTFEDVCEQFKKCFTPESVTLSVVKPL